MQRSPLSLLAVLSLAMTSSLAAQSPPAYRGSAAVPDLSAGRAATERFRDVNVALAEGYIRDPMNVCDSAEMLGRPASLGVMGIHYLRPDLLQITATEPRVSGNGIHTNFLRYGRAKGEVRRILLPTPDTERGYATWLKDSLGLLQIV